MKRCGTHSCVIKKPTAMRLRIRAASVQCRMRATLEYEEVSGLSDDKLLGLLELNLDHDINIGANRHIFIYPKVLSLIHI